MIWVTKMLDANGIFILGIVILLTALLGIAIFYPVHIYLSKRAKKQIELEYGKNPTDKDYKDAMRS